jgi:hypothetical protein
VAVGRIAGHTRPWSSGVVEDPIIFSIQYGTRPFLHRQQTDISILCEVRMCGTYLLFVITRHGVALKHWDRLDFISPPILW